MSDTLQVEARQALGSANSRRLRAEGMVPAVLYGHKEEAVSLAISSKQIRAALKHNAKVVNLNGAADGQALLQDIQWDTFHRHLLHLDLLRVSAGEKVNVTVPVELKGDAVGLNEGGLVEQTMTTVEIEAAPASIPEILHIDVTNLHLGGSMTAADIIDLPAGATLLTDETEMLVHCVPPAGEPALDDSVAADAGSPEVIGEKKEESEES